MSANKSSVEIKAASALGVCLLLVLVSVCAAEPARARSSGKFHVNLPLTINNSSANLTLVDFFHLHNNSLRNGFEPFFFITNEFIDNLFLPNIPTYEETTEESDESVKKKPTPMTQVYYKGFVLSVNNVGEALVNAFKLYPSLFVFVVCVILVSFLVAFVGLIICCYRSFCRPKFNRFDTKFEAIKRRIIAAVLSMFLIVNLPAIIILFFTNQNAFKAVEKMPTVANETFTQIGGYLEKDASIFFSRILDQIDILRKDVPASFDEILEKSLNRSFEKLTTQDLITAYNQGLSVELQKNHDLFTNMLKLIDQIKPDLLTEGSPRSKIVELNKKLEDVQKLINQSLNVLPNQTNGKSFSFGSFLVDSNDRIKSLKSKYVEAIDSFLDQNAQDVKNVSASMDKFGGTLKSIDKSALSEKTEKYRYLYLIKLGFSVLCAFLFALFAFGLAGIFCSRPHNNYKQTCHRGISANFLLAAVGLFFIFAVSIAAVSALLSIFGIFARQLVCKPAIDLDQNEAFRIIQKVPKINTYIGDLKIYQLLSECKLFGHSNEYKKHIKRKLIKFIDTKKPMIIDNLENEILKSNEFNLTNSLENLRANLKKLNTSLQEFSRIENENLEKTMVDLNEIKAKLDKQSAALLEFDLSLFQKQASDLTKNTKKELNEFMTLLESKLNSSVSQAANSSLAQVSMKTLLDETIMANFDSMIDQKIDIVFESSPSCRAISNVYLSVVQTGCFEFLDNFNTFWFTLLVIFVLNIFIAIFSLVLADLFRKYYPYEEILATEVSNYDKESNELKGASNEALDDIGRLRFYNRPRTDAFEMNRYYRPDYRPDYYDKRA